MLLGRRGQTKPADLQSQLCFPAAPAEMQKRNTCRPRKSHESPRVICKGQSTTGKTRGNHTTGGEMEGNRSDPEGDIKTHLETSVFAFSDYSHPGQKRRKRCFSNVIQSLSALCLSLCSSLS